MTSLHFAFTAWLGSVAWSAVAADAPQPCRAQSAASPPAIVELYTSEGCSSCPPADRWLSGLKGRSDVLALAFHVNYWDRLGWPDRFANAQTTERQHRLQRASGAAHVYTPQVVLNGRDWRQWSAGGLKPLADSRITIALERHGHTVSARIGDAGDASLAGYWAVLEDGHESRVRAGENAGSTLKHDHVVTLYRPVASIAGPLTLELSPAAPRESTRRVAFVVTEASGLRPLQAAVLRCG
jgi:hypothetical protein